MNFLKNESLLSFNYGEKSFSEWKKTISKAENSNEIITEYILKVGRKVTNVFKTYPEFNACEWVTWFENTGEKNSQIISNLYDCDANIPFEHDDPDKFTAYIPDPDLDMKVYSPRGADNRKDAFYSDMDEYTWSANRFAKHIYPGQTKHFSTSGGSSAPAMTANYTFSERDSFGDNEDEMTWFKSCVEEYLRVRPYLSCDMYPLAGFVFTEDVWSAVEYNRVEEKDGIILVYRRKNSPYTASTFRLFGLDESKTYVFTDADDDSTFEVSGKELLTDGLNLEILSCRTAKLYFYKEK